MKLAVLLVHGIGDTREDWAKPVIEKLQKKVLAELKRLLSDQAPADISEVLIIQSVYWKNTVQKPQERLRGILDDYRKALLAGLHPLLRLLIWVFRRWYRFQNHVTTWFIGDITAYLTEDAQRAVHARLDGAVKACAGHPLSIVSHSLGTVIASNYVYDAKKSSGGEPKLSNFFTVGSPLALFSLKFGGPDFFRKPIRVDEPRGRWINFLDRDDPIGMPLKPLNKEYDEAVFADVQVQAGIWGFAHTKYFDHSDTLDRVARKLAIDWADKNQKLSAEKTAKLYEDYDAKKH